VAWQLARDHIVERWNWAADPANSAPQVPAPMRQAVSIMRSHGEAVLSTPEVDRIVEALEGAYPVRLQRDLRERLSASTGSREAVVAIQSFVADNGLRGAPEYRRLPVIAAEDVHLICWMGVTPAEIGKRDVLSSERL
jgi:hypothetical protein